jgi:hypothetical protein
MKHILITLLCVTLLGITNCDPCKRLNKLCPAKDSVNYIETVTQDTNYTIPDSLFWRMSFECDSAYNVLLKDFTEINSGLTTDVKIKEVVRTVVDKKSINILTLYLRVSSDSIQTLNKTIEKLKNTVKTVTIEKEVPVYKCRKFFIYCTITLFVVVILFAGWNFLKYKAKILSLIK